MSIAQWQQVKNLMAKVEEQGKELRRLREQVEALEAKPRVGRPPKAENAAAA